MDISTTENANSDNNDDNEVVCLPKKITFVNNDVGFKNPTEALRFKTDDRFCRVTLRAGLEPKEIFVNGNILALSPFFNAMLTKENHEEPIDLLDMDFEAVDSLITYLYTGTLEISEDTVENLLITSERFELPEVLAKCIDVLTEQLQPENCLRKREFAVLHGFHVLKKNVDNFINNNFSVMAAFEDFLKLTPSELLETISNCSKETTTVGAIFKAIIRWVEHDESNRSDHLTQLIKKIDLGQLFEDSPETLQLAFGDGTLLQRNHECSLMYYKMCESKAYQNSSLLKQTRTRSGRAQKASLQQTEFDQFVQLTTTGVPSPGLPTPRRHLSTQEGRGHLSLRSSTGEPIRPIPKIISAVTAYSRPRRHEGILNVQFAPGMVQRSVSTPAGAVKMTVSAHKRKRVTESCSPDRERQPLPTNSIKDKILVYPRVLNRKQYMDSYNFTTKMSTRIHEIRPPRVIAGVISYQKRLFYIGGTTELHCRSEDNDSRTASAVVDVFIEGQNLLSERYKLIEPTKEFGACICQNYLYVIGGCQGIEAVNCAERLPLFKKKKPKWESIDYMKFARGAHDVAVVDDKIYAIGGVGQVVARGGAIDLNSVVRYVPEKDIWENMPSMNEAKGFARTGVIGTDIYVVGGNVWEYGITDRRSLNTVEVFDTQRYEWRIGPPMNHCRSRGMVFVQNDLLYAVGGNSKLAQSMEVYDPRIEKWMQLEWPIGLDKDADFYAATSFDV